MARIQILELPSEQVGELFRTPFAIVIDQVEMECIKNQAGETMHTVSELTQAEADVIARNMGAVSAVLVACTLDVQ